MLHECKPPSTALVPTFGTWCLATGDGEGLHPVHAHVHVLVLLLISSDLEKSPLWRSLTPGR